MRKEQHRKQQNNSQKTVNEAAIEVLIYQQSLSIEMDQILQSKDIKWVSG